MTGFVRGALAVTTGLALLATSAMASVPSPANSDVDPVAVGNVTGTALKGGGFGTTVGGIGFSVVVRDIGGVLINGANVTVDFNTAAGNTGGRGAGLVRAYNPQVTGTCAGDVFSKATNTGGDPAGTARFRLIFGGAENDASIEVRANGVLLALIKARSTDLTASNGPDGRPTGLADVAILQSNTYSGANVSGATMEADFTLSPGPDTKPVGLADLALLQADIYNLAANIAKVDC